MPLWEGEVLALFDKMSKKSVESLSNLTEAKMDETWTMRNGDVVYFTLPKAVVMRQFVFSHIVHHRAQLGVYLRILGIPVPGTYGPSADES